MGLPVAFGWRHLLFENWPVDATLLNDHLPDALPAATHDGSAWLSVVPLTNVHVRPRGLPARAGVRLPELNLRTYVTHDGDPGVYFFSLDAQGVLSVLGARLLHHLPYFYARIDHRVEGDRVRFESRRLHPGSRPARYAVSYRPTGDPFEADPGSLAEFLTERRRLYTQGRDGAVRYTDVEHDRWTLHPAAVTTDENTLFEAGGFAHPESEPVCYYSPGVDVVTGPSRRATPRA
ncbi:YqjF family protein [Halorarum halobium]|uniref:YqjF family protein n=1 Tax=Halorarum halobium TaxID=3075121 RepID=UPI0028ADB981|nr:DUF2071 domain-containing protein [Halobaculum sp. XH14]